MTSVCVCVCVCVCDGGREADGPGCFEEKANFQVSAESGTMSNISLNPLLTGYTYMLSS